MAWTIWNEWAKPDGNLGRVYGAQWCDWRTTDGRSINQIDQVIGQIKKNPDSRRHIVSAWNPGEIEQMALPPCHALFQFYVSDPPSPPATARQATDGRVEAQSAKTGGELSCQLYQRSADIFLGVPFNIASYALLTLMVAQGLRIEARRFRPHLRRPAPLQNHVDQAKLQLSREPRPLPQMKLNPAVKDIHDFKFEDFELTGYEPASRHQSADCGVKFTARRARNMDSRRCNLRFATIKITGPEGVEQHWPPTPRSFITSSSRQKIAGACWTNHVVTICSVTSGASSKS